MTIIASDLSGFEVDAGKFPEFLTVASFAIGEPSNAVTGFDPVPSRLDPGGEQRFVLQISLRCDPVATLTLNKVYRPAFRFTGGEGSRSRECRPHRLRPSHRHRLAQAATPTQLVPLDALPTAG